MLENLAFHTAGSVLPGYDVKETTVSKQEEDEDVLGTANWEEGEQILS